MLRPLLPIAVLIVTSACGGDSTSVISRQWSYATASPASPPGVGPERRVVVGVRSGTGTLVTLNQENGLALEGPFSGALPTAHAPLANGNRLFLVSTIGKWVAYDFGGVEVYSRPSTPFGNAAAPRFAPDGSARVGTTSGRLLAFAVADGATIFDTSIGAPITSPPAIASNGTTYVATDTGRLVGVDGAGTIGLDVTVGAPASGPSVDPATGRVAVGDVDGVHVFEASGAEVFQHARAARVVGTRFDDGDLIAWGEDGVVERLDADGSVKSTFRAGPPIYADVIPLKSGGLAVFDSAGIAYRLGSDGQEEARLDLEGVPSPEVILNELGTVLVTVDSAVRAFDFAFE